MWPGVVFFVLFISGGIFLCLCFSLHTAVIYSAVGSFLCNETTPSPTIPASFLLIVIALGLYFTTLLFRLNAHIESIRKRSISCLTIIFCTLVCTSLGVMCYLGGSPTPLDGYLVLGISITAVSAGMIVCAAVFISIVHVTNPDACIDWRHTAGRTVYRLKRRRNEDEESARESKDKKDETLTGEPPNDYRKLDEPVPVGKMIKRKLFGERDGTVVEDDEELNQINPDQYKKKEEDESSRNSKSSIADLKPSRPRVAASRSRPSVGSADSKDAPEEDPTQAVSGMSGQLPAVSGQMPVVSNSGILIL